MDIVKTQHNINIVCNVVIYYKSVYMNSER